MKFRVEVVCVQDDGSEQRCDVVELERQQLVMETLGLSVAEGKTILHGVQEFVTAQQTAADLHRRRTCTNCGKRYESKAGGQHTVNAVFGAVAVAQSTVASLCVPNRRSENSSANGGLAERPH